MRISIQMSDPWDLGESIGWAPLLGAVVQVPKDDQGNCDLIRLDAPVSWKGEQWRYIAAGPRHAGTKISTLKLGTELHCGMIGVTDDEAQNGSAWVSRPRSKFYLIGTVRRL